MPGNVGGSEYALPWMLAGCPDSFSLQDHAVVTDCSSFSKLIWMDCVPFDEMFLRK